MIIARLRYRYQGRSALALSALALSACASYTARPLTDAGIDAVLASPDRSALVQRAARLSHPRLPPVTLDFANPLSPDELAVIAILANPDLRALRAQQQVADAQAFASGLLPDPQITFGIDKVLSPLDQGLSPAYVGSLTLDLLGALVTRSVEHQRSRAAVEQVRLDIAWQELITAGQAQLLAVRLPRQRLVAQLARQAAEVAEAGLHRTLTAAARGDLKGDEVEARRIAASDASTRALSAERDADTTALELNRIVGLMPGEPLMVADAPPLEKWHPPDAMALFAAARASRLDLQALSAGYDSQQAALRRAVLGQYPRLAITLNRARDTSQVQTFGPAVTLDLPLWNRSRGAIAVAEATRDRLRSEYAARLFQTRADIAALVAALNRNEQARVALAAQLPEIERIADGFDAAARRGDLTVSLAESAHASAVDKRLAFLALDQACAEQRVALELAIGNPFSVRIQTP
jgi:outer membrane protein TolC